MDVNIYITRFTRNDPNLKVEDVAFNFRTNIRDNGIVELDFQTKDKYLFIRADGFICGIDYSGETLELMPTFMDTVDLDEVDLNLKRPDYYWLELAVEMPNPDDVYMAHVVALKNAYRVLFIPWDIILADNYDEFTSAELIDKRHA